MDRERDQRTAPRNGRKPIDEGPPSEAPTPAGRSAADRETRALFALADTVVRSLSLDEVLDRILDLVDCLFGARAVWIRLLDEETGQLKVRAARGRGTSTILAARLRPGQGIAGDAFVRQIIRTVPDIQAEPRFANHAVFAEAGINEVILVPLIAGGRSIGILAYCPELAGQALQPPPRLLALLSLFAAHAALGIQHAAIRAEALSARDRAERTAQRLAAIQQLEEAAGQVTDLASLLGRAAPLAAAALGGRHGAVALSDPAEAGRRHSRGRLVVGTATGIWPDLPWRRLPLGRLASLVALVAERRHAIVVVTAEHDTRLGRLKRFLDAAGATRLLLAPVASGDRFMGVLAVDDGGRASGREARERPAFSHGDLALAESLGARLGAALDRIRLIESERRRARELFALQRTTQHLASTLSLSGLLPVVVEEAGRLLEADAVTLRLREGDDLVLAAHTPGLVDRGARGSVAIGRPVSGLVAAANAPLIIPDLMEDPRGQEATLWRQMALRSYLGVPIQAGGVVAGVLGFYSRRPRRFERRDIELSATLADVIAVALDNARLFERVLQAMREWEATFNAMRAGIALVDAEGRIVRTNGALARLLDTTPADLAGRPFDEAAPGLTSERETSLRGRTLALSVSPLTGRDGRNVGAVYAVRDVTEERRLQEQLLQSEKLASIGQLVSGVAHELNNPLAAIMGYAELLLRQVTEPSLAHDIGQVKAQAERASRIVHNLRAFARRHPPEKRLISLNDVAHTAIELQAYDLRVSDIEVEEAFDLDLPRTMADFHQIEEVVVNILVNAKQAILEAGRGGRVRVETRGVRTPERRTARLMIHDTGPGIRKEDLHRVFDPFFTTKPVGVGTGLGLSICFGILEQHGGGIWVESEPGRGTTVSIELPASPHAAPGPAATAAGAARGEGDEGSPSEEAARGRGVLRPGAGLDPGRPAAARILVVDDEPGVREVVAGMLRLEGYDVETAEDGRAAAARLEADRYDLVLADVRMPGMGGAELADWLAASRPDMAGRLVFMTGDTAGTSTQHLLESSGRPFLPKPFSHTELMAFVHDALDVALTRRA